LVKLNNSRFYTTIATILGAVLGLLTGCGMERANIKKEIQAESISITPQELPEYRLHPGDQLDIKFFYNPELNETVPVRPDGKISLQLVGDITSAGLTPPELGALLNQKYAQELKTPAVTVIVKSFTGQQVYVAGEVERQGIIDLTTNMTALQAVIKAGGFKETAKPESVIVIRRGIDNQPIPYQLNLKTTDNQTLAFQLQSYDIVYVPKTWIAEANKFVHEYIEQLLLFKGFYFSWSPTIR
jgi:protein involved in polysaccharide export with SLBB domain